MQDSRSLIIDAYRASQPFWLIKGVGVGADAEYLLSTVGTYANAHSAFWKIWVELGLIGLALWALLLVGLAVRVKGSSDRAFFVLAAVPIILFFMTLGPLNSNVLWVVLGLALGSSPRNGEAHGSGSGSSSTFGASPSAS